jgi:hypothetical protein
MTGTDAERLIDIVKSTRWLLHALLVVRDLGIPSAYIGAGAIRNAVWDRLHGYSEPTKLTDIDVVYFNPIDLSNEADKRIETSLRSACPEIPWEVTNQAAVHLWYEKHFGEPVEPLRSIEEAVGTWPETATSVAIKMSIGNGIDIIAPFGLDDLFAMIIRRNTKRVSYRIYMERIRSKNYQQRWPKVQTVFEAQPNG